MSDTIREALEELVACKDLSHRLAMSLDEAGIATWKEWRDLHSEYRLRDSASWEAARAALAAQPVEPAPGYCKHCKQYTIEEPLAAQPAQAQHYGFDAWKENVYTKVLEKSIAEDYVPRAQPAQPWACPKCGSPRRAHVCHTPQPAQDDEDDILATYSGKEGRRDWVNVGCWLRPGEEIVHRAIKVKP